MLLGRNFGRMLLWKSVRLLFQIDRTPKMTKGGNLENYVENITEPPSQIECSILFKEHYYLVETSCSGWNVILLFKRDPRTWLHLRMCLMHLDMQLLEFKQLAEQAQHLSCQTAPWSSRLLLKLKSEVSESAGSQIIIQVIRPFQY